MKNKHKAPNKNKPVRYESYATNIRLHGMAIVLCKMPYEKEHGDPEILEKIIGDALEFYFKNRPQEKTTDADFEKKDVANE